MKVWDGRVMEITLDGSGAASAWVECPPGAIPGPGQYLLAWSPEDVSAPLAAVLFPAQVSAEGFLAAPTLPLAWGPGTPLHLRGPLGHGFHLPNGTRRLALAALGETAARLMPVLSAGLARGADAAIFAGCPLPQLPTAVEIHSLGALLEALPWADFLAFDLPLERLAELPALLGRKPAPCPGQALIVTPMPCGGLSECGACALPVRREHLLACLDGPVFNLAEIFPA